MKTLQNKLSEASASWGAGVPGYFEVYLNGTLTKVIKDESAAIKHAKDLIDQRGSTVEVTVQDRNGNTIFEFNGREHLVGEGVNTVKFKHNGEVLSGTAVRLVNEGKQNKSPYCVVYAKGCTESIDVPFHSIIKEGTDQNIRRLMGHKPVKAAKPTPEEVKVYIPGVGRMRRDQAKKYYPDEYAALQKSNKGLDEELNEGPATGQGNQETGGIWQGTKDYAKGLYDRIKANLAAGYQQREKERLERNIKAKHNPDYGTEYRNAFPSTTTGTTPVASTNTPNPAFDKARWDQVVGKIGAENRAHKGWWQNRDTGKYMHPDEYNRLASGSTGTAAPAARSAAPAATSNSQPFGQAFGKARASGQDTFTWTDPRTGKASVYNTKLAAPATTTSAAPAAAPAATTTSATTSATPPATTTSATTVSGPGEPLSAGPTPASFVDTSPTIHPGEKVIGREGGVTYTERPISSEPNTRIPAPIIDKSTPATAADVERIEKWEKSGWNPRNWVGFHAGTGEQVGRDADGNITRTQVAEPKRAKQWGDTSGSPWGDEYSHLLNSKDNNNAAITEHTTKEDVLSNKKSSIDSFVSKTPKINNGPAVKTITTHDGKSISIHGNENDGFNISANNRLLGSRFASLDEASMAVEMYCNRRLAVIDANNNQDYVDER